MNISSVVVKTSPEDEKRVIEDLKRSGLCEVHFHDTSGKIIVTVEGEDVNDEVGKMKAIINLPGVLSASLAYACSEEGTGVPARGGGERGAVPKVLREA